VIFSMKDRGTPLLIIRPPEVLSTGVLSDMKHARVTIPFRRDG